MEEMRKKTKFVPFDSLFWFFLFLNGKDAVKYNVKLAKLKIKQWSKNYFGRYILFCYERYDICDLYNFFVNRVNILHLFGYQPQTIYTITN